MSQQGQHRLTDEIISLKKAVKEKYLNFKQGKQQFDIQLEKQYRPLIKEIRKSKRPVSVKVEPKDEPKEELEDIDESHLFKPQTFSSPQRLGTVFEDEEVYESPNPDLTTVLSSPEGMQNASQFVETKFSDPLTKRYMMKLMKDIGGAKRKIDHTFGPRYEHDTLMVGTKALGFTENGSISIGDVTYKPTEGLYELLFKRLPDDQLYDDNDLNAYKDILLKTHAHKRGYSSSATVNRDNSIKYKTVIAKLFPKSSYSGKGLTKAYGRDLKYWDDPNELCDRLRLLIASAEVGNSNHKNEIINIVEELKEAGYIRGNGNSRLRSLLR